MKIINVLQGTTEWLEARMGIPTASNFHRIVTPKTLKLSEQRYDYANRLLAEWLLGESMEQDFNNVAMERGTELEDRARAWYSFDRGVEVVEVGFCLNDAGTAGFSPDGLVGEDGGVEIKVPMAPKCVSYLIGREKLGTEEHRIQVQSTLWLGQRKWWDCIAWNPAMNRIPATLVRVEPDKEVFAAFDEHIPTFLSELAQSKAYLIEKKGCTPKGLPVTAAELIR